jgi:SAM-dependent methyltransferase
MREWALDAMSYRAGSADAVLATATTGSVALLLRTADVPKLALLRIRSEGEGAVQEALANLKGAGCRIVRLALNDGHPASQPSPRHALREVARAVARRVVVAGQASGLCSRPTRNLEIWRVRASEEGGTPAARCPLCGADASMQLPLPLRTSADVWESGQAFAVLCSACEVARTDPLPADGARAIAPDVEPGAMSGVQRLLLRWFIRERVKRVRALLPELGRPRVADIGGGACAFANALAATGCDVTVFEPNAANRAFADVRAGVRFVGAPFDDTAVAASGIAPASLDAITLWHALEHVPCPADTLSLARRLLRPGGIIYVCVPNLDSLQADLAGTRWCYADIPRHVTHFSPEGLERLLRQAGFGECHPYWWNAEYEIFGWYQSLLNVLTRSHNYFYNRAKKGRAGDEGPSPAWTRVATALGPLLLPAAMVGSWLGSQSSKPACVEMHGVAR